MLSFCRGIRLWKCSDKTKFNILKAWKQISISGIHKMKETCHLGCCRLWDRVWIYLKVKWEYLWSCKQASYNICLKLWKMAVVWRSCALAGVQWLSGVNIAVCERSWCLDQHSSCKYGREETRTPWKAEFLELAIELDLKNKGQSEHETFFQENISCMTDLRFEPDSNSMPHVHSQW